MIRSTSDNCHKPIVEDARLGGTCSSKCVSDNSSTSENNKMMWTRKELRGFFPKQLNDWPYSVDLVKEAVNRCFYRIVPYDHKFFFNSKKYMEQINIICLTEGFEYNYDYITEAIECVISLTKPEVTFNPRVFPTAFFDSVVEGRMSLRKPTSYTNIRNQWLTHMKTLSRDQKSKVRGNRKDMTIYNQLWSKYHSHVVQALDESRPFDTVGAPLNDSADELLQHPHDEKDITNPSEPTEETRLLLDDQIIEFAEAFKDSTGLQIIEDECIVTSTRMISPDQANITIDFGGDAAEVTVFTSTESEEAERIEALSRQRKEKKKILDEDQDGNESSLDPSSDVIDFRPHIPEPQRPENFVIDIDPHCIHLEIEKEFAPDNVVLVSHPSVWTFYFLGCFSLVSFFVFVLMTPFFGWWCAVPLLFGVLLLTAGLLFMLFSTFYLSRNSRKKCMLLNARRVVPSFMVETDYLTMKFYQGPDEVVNATEDLRPQALKCGELESDSFSYKQRTAYCEIESNPSDWLVRFFVNYGLSQKIWNIKSVHRYEMHFLPDLLSSVLDIKALQSLSMVEYVARVKQIMASSVHFNFDKTRILNYENLAMNTYIVAAILKKNDENLRLGNFHRELWTQAPSQSM